MIQATFVATSGSGALFGPGRGLFASLVAYGLALAAIPLGILLGLWILLARSAFLHGDDDMERPSRVAQLYGYSVCLIAVVVFLVSTNSLVANLFSLGAPLQARESEFGAGFEPSVSSFEAYRATVGRTRAMGVSPGAERADSASEATLRSRYEALRVDRIQRARFQAERGIATSGLSLLIAIALFLIHWRWLRSAPANGRYSGGEPRRTTA
jgi:hypothetical protein